MGVERLAAAKHGDELLDAPRAGVRALVIVWELLSNPNSRFHDLGADYHDTRVDKHRKTRNHLRQLQALGYLVTLTPAA